VSGEVFAGGAWQSLGKPVVSTTTVDKAGGVVLPPTTVPKGTNTTTTAISGRVGVVTSGTTTSTEYNLALPGTAVNRNTVYVRLKLTANQPLFTAGAVRLAAA
jgi:hypothetical protein